MDMTSFLERIILQSGDSSEISALDTNIKQVFPLKSLDLELQACRKKSNKPTPVPNEGTRSSLIQIFQIKLMTPATHLQNLKFSSSYLPNFLSFPKWFPQFSLIFSKFSPFFSIASEALSRWAAPRMAPLHRQGLLHGPAAPRPPGPATPSAAPAPHGPRRSRSTGHRNPSCAAVGAPGQWNRTRSET